MTQKKSLVSLAVGTAFVATASLAPIAHAADNPFGMQKLSGGYLIAEADTKAKEASCGGDKHKAGSCGGEKKKEGKCGEGKCGADKKKEGKCGEGKCGADKKKEGSCGGEKK